MKCRLRILIRTIAEVSGIRGSKPGISLIIPDQNNGIDVNMVEFKTHLFRILDGDQMQI